MSDDSDSSVPLVRRPTQPREEAEPTGHYRALRQQEESETGPAPSDAPTNDDEHIERELFGEGGDDEEDDGDDLFADNMERDYEPNPELDRLSPSGLDDSQVVSDLTFADRRAAEREMDARDGRVSVNDMLYGSDMASTAGSQRRGARRLYASDFVVDADAANAEAAMPIDMLEDTKGRSTRDHISDEACGKELKRRFIQFLTMFTVSGAKKYQERINHMAMHNRASFVVDYIDLASNNGEQHIAYFLPEAPIEMIEYLDSAATALTFSWYPKFKDVTPRVRVRIANLPMVEEIRQLRQLHLNQLVCTKGVVTTTTGVLPQLSLVKYDCVKCGYVIGPYMQRQNEETRPSACPDCQSRGPFDVNMEETVYENYQRITIQESPNTVAAGRLPRNKEVILLADLCDACRPGDEIELTGIYTNNYDGSMNSKQGFPVFNTVIIGNHIVKKEDKESSESLTDEDLRAIRLLSKDKRIAERIMASVAPSIYGHADIKRGIALAMFGGVPKNPGDKHRVRGDINVLLCGDPGTAKSQFLRYVSTTAPRSVLTTGQGASAVGLTAYVQRHPVTREWTLEAGALVLADKGVCLIDEFDKMNDADRTSIHEAMEQQSISISKAGIVASLQARCTIIAAANPISGRYDTSRTFAENVDLSEPILSRFDVLCVVRDTVDPAEDERLARFVVRSHLASHPDRDATKELVAKLDAVITEKYSSTDESDPQPIPQSMLRKYIQYAREKVRPTLNSIPEERIAKLYSDLRRESMATGSVPITVRHVESVIRMAEAHAKMHLRGAVHDGDVNVAIRAMLDAFVSTQKFSVMRQMRRTFARYYTGNRQFSDILLFTLKQMVAEQLRYRRARHRQHNGPLGERPNADNVDELLQTIEINDAAFREQVGSMHVNAASINSFYQSSAFAKSGYVYDGARKCIVVEL